MPRKLGHDNYHAERFQTLLSKLLDDADESYRGASTAAGLDSSAISRYMGNTRPSRDACIALADHFGINPNKMLEAAGYAPLRFFERREFDPKNVTPQAKRILEKLEQITDPKTRERLSEVIEAMLEGHLILERDAATSARAEPSSESMPSTDKAADQPV